MATSDEKAPPKADTMPICVNGRAGKPKSISTRSAGTAANLSGPVGILYPHSVIEEHAVKDTASAQAIAASFVTLCLLSFFELLLLFVVAFPIIRFRLPFRVQLFHAVNSIGQFSYGELVCE